MTGRAFKDAVYEQLARIGKALASPRRLELLDLLRQGPRTVEELAEQSGQSLANTSHHLQELRTHRLVEAEKKGLYVTYRIADEDMSVFFSVLRRVAESRLAEIEKVARQFFGTPDGLIALDRASLLRQIKAGAVTVIDVRPRKEYEAGHIPGALSIPVAELKRRLKTLPRNRQIVAYCRGPYCVMAKEAVQILKERGYRAARLDLGVPEWKEMGLPVAHRAPAITH